MFSFNILFGIGMEAELGEDMPTSPVWDNLCMVTDLRLCNQGLQTPICVCSLLFQCNSAVTGSGRAKPEWVLFKIFSGHKEGQWFTANIRSVCSEQALVHKLSVQVQDADTQGPDTLCTQAIGSQP